MNADVSKQESLSNESKEGKIPVTSAVKYEGLSLAEVRALVL